MFENTLSDKLITPQEAAQILSVSVITIKKWLRSGKLRGSKLGGSSGVWRTSIGACKDLYDKGRNTED